MTDALTLSEVLALTKMSRATLYRRIDHEGFPRPEGFIGVEKLWRRAAVEQWMGAQSCKD